MRIDFYHLTALPLDRVLPPLVQKILADGGRLLIVAHDESRRAAIDRLLWTYQPDSFLPHAQLAGDDGDAAQPALIAPDVNAANAARNIALVDGVWRDEALDFDRAFHLFDEDSIRPARAAWKALGERDDITRRYWKQNETGRWEQAA